MNQSPEQIKNQEVWLRNSLNRNSRLENEVKSFQDQIKNKNQQLVQLESEYKVQVSQLQSQLLTNQQLQSQLQQLSQLNLDYKRTIEQLTDQNNSLKAQLKQVSDSNNIEKHQQQALIDRANQDIQRLKNDIMSLQRNNDSLQQQKNYQIKQLDVSSKKALEDLQEQMHKLQLQATSKIEQLTSELQISNTLIEKLQQDLNQKKNEIYTSTANYEVVNATKSQQINQVQQSQQKLQQDYNDKLTQFQMQAQMRITQLESEVAQKKIQLEKANVDLAKKTKEIKDNNLHCEQISTQYQKKIQEMMGSVQNLQLQLDHENNNFGRKKEDFHAQIDNLQRDLQLQSQTTNQYTLNLNKEIEELKKKNLELQKQLGEKNKQNGLLKSEMDGQTKQYNFQLSSLQTELNLKNELLKQNEDQMHQLNYLKQQEIEKLQFQFEQRQKELLIQIEVLNNNAQVQSQRVITLSHDESNKQMKQLDQFWSDKYSQLTQQMKSEIAFLSQQFQAKQSENDVITKEKYQILENQHLYSLKQQHDIYENQIIGLNKQILQLQKEKENQILELDVASVKLKELQFLLQNNNNKGQNKDEQVSTQIASLQQSKEELLNLINQEQLNHKKELFNLQKKIDFLSSQNERFIKEALEANQQLKQSKLDAQQAQNLSHIKNKESVNSVVERESEIIRLQSELTRVESLYKQVVLEIKIVNEQKEDLKVMDDFMIKEKDAQILNLKNSIIEQKQKLQHLEKRCNESDVQLKRESEKALQFGNESKKQLQILNQRLQISKKQLEDERKRLEDLIKAQEMEVNAWNQRLKEQQKLNEDLITQMMRLQQQAGQNSNLINELLNLKQQFELVTNQYKRLQDDAYEATKQKSMVKNAQMQTLQNHYTKQLDYLTKELEEMQQKSLNQKVSFPIMDFNVQIIALNDLIVAKNSEIVKLKSANAYKLLEKDDVIDKQREYSQQLQNAIDTLKTQIQNQQEIQERVENLQIINEEKDNTIQFLKEECQKIKQENQLIKGKLDLKEQSMVVIHDQQQLIRQLKQELKNKSKNIQPKQIAISHIQTIKSSIHRMSKKSESSKHEQNQIHWNNQESEFAISDRSEQIPCFNRQASDSFADNRTIEKINQEIVDTNIRLRNKVEYLHQVNQTKEQQFHSLQIQCNQLVDENRELSLKVQFTQKALQSSQQQHEQLERDLKQQQPERKISFKSHDLTSKVKELNQEIDTLQTQKTFQTSQISQLQHEQSDLYKQLNRVNDQNKQLRTTINDLTTQNQNMEQSLVELQTKLKQEQILSVKQNSEVRVFQLKQDQTSQILSFENQQLKLQNADLLVQNQEQIQLIQNQTMTIEKYRCIEKKYNEQSLLFNSYLQKIDQLESEKQLLEQDSAKILQESNQLITRNESYVSQVSTLERTYQQLKLEITEQQQQYQKQVQFLEREKQQLQNQVKLLNLTLQNVQRLNKSGSNEEELKANNCIYENKINELNQLVSEKQLQIKAFQFQIEQLQSEITKLKSENQSLQQMYLPVQNQVEELQQLIEQKQKQLELQQQTKSFSQEQRINELEEEVKEKSSIISDFTFKNIATDQQYKSSSKEMNELRQKITQYLLINEQLQQQIDELITNQERMKLSFEEKQTDYQNSVRRQIQQIHARSVDLLDQIDELNKQNSETKMQNTKLNSELREQEIELSKQKQQYLEYLNQQQELFASTTNENNQLKLQIHQMEIEFQNVKFKDNQSVSNLTASQELKFKQLYELSQERENKLKDLNKELQHQLVVQEKQMKTMQNRINNLEDEIKQQQEKESIKYESVVTFTHPDDFQQLHDENIKLASQVQIFSSQHYVYEQQLNEYNEKLQLLEYKQENEIKSINEMHRKELQSQIDQLQQVSNQCKDYEKKYELLMNRYDETVEQVNKLQKANQSFSLQLFNNQKELSNQNQVVDEKLQQVNLLNQQLLRQISQLNNCRLIDQDDINSLNIKIKQQYDDIVNYQENIRELQSRIELTNNNECEQLLEQILELTEQKNNLLTSVKEQAQKIKQISSENDNLKNQRQSLTTVTSRSQQLSTEFQQNVKQGIDQNELLKQEVEILKQQITQEQSLVAREQQSYKRQIEKLQDQIQQYSSQRTEQQQTQDKQFSQQQIESLKLQVEFYLNKSKTHEAQCQKLEENNFNLNQEINLLRKTDIQLKYKQKKKALKNKIIELENQLSKRESDCSKEGFSKQKKLQSYYDKEMEEKQRLINSLEEQFKILQKGYEDQDTEIKQLDDENSKLRYQSENCHNELAILKINQNLSKNPNQENKLLELRIQKLTSQLDELQLKLSDSENDLADMIENYRVEQKRSRELEQHSKILKQQLIDVEAKYKQIIVREFPNYANKKLDDALIRLVSDLKALQAVPTANSQQSNSIADLQHQNQEMLEEIHILVEKVKQSDLENMELQEQLQYVTQNNSNYSSRRSITKFTDQDKDKKIIDLENKLALLASENSRLNHMKNKQQMQLQQQNNLPISDIYQR